jgi:hypothetical protein
MQWLRPLDLRDHNEMRDSRSHNYVIAYCDYKPTKPHNMVPNYILYIPQNHTNLITHSLML